MMIYTSIIFCISYLATTSALPAAPNTDIASIIQSINISSIVAGNPELAKIKQPASTFLTTTDATNIVNFLTTDVMYTASQGVVKGLGLPLSFAPTSGYFGDYVCGMTQKYDGKSIKNDCNFVPSFTSDLSDIAKNQYGLEIERVIQKSGLDIYDGACHQIALALAGAETKNSTLLEMSANLDLLMANGFMADAAELSFASPGVYGTTTITGQDKSKMPFMQKIIPRQPNSEDVFNGTPFVQKFLANGGPQYSQGTAPWMGQSGVTGETVWAAFIGPLQAAYLRDTKVGGKKCVDFTSNAVKNARNTLFAVSAMQSAVGGLLHSIGDPAGISVENCASGLAGLTMFRQLMTMYATNACPLDATQTQQVADAILTLNMLIDGGANPVTGLTTGGLTGFFKSFAWDEKARIFLTTGAVTSTNPPAWTTSGPQAVDVVTWTLATLGVVTIDREISTFGAAFDAWNNIKNLAGFFRNGVLQGVGYSNEDGNGPKANTGGVMSGEWTMGAINAVRALEEQYTVMATTASPEENTKISATILPSLAADLKSMTAGMDSLRSDAYGVSPTSVALYGADIPANFSTLSPSKVNNLSFMYASTRFYIPFGWWANAQPSTASTTWALYAHYNFNPMVLGGKYVPFKG